MSCTRRRYLISKEYQIYWFYNDGIHNLLIPSNVLAAVKKAEAPISENVKSTKRFLRLTESKIIPLSEQMKSNIRNSVRSYEDLDKYVYTFDDVKYYQEFEVEYFTSLNIPGSWECFMINSNDNVMCGVKGNIKNRTGSIYSIEISGDSEFQICFEVMPLIFNKLYQLVDKVYVNPDDSMGKCYINSIGSKFNFKCGDASKPSKDEDCDYMIFIRK